LYNIAHIAQECFEELHNIVQYCVHCWHIYCTNIAQYCAICVQYCVHYWHIYCTHIAQYCAICVQYCAICVQYCVILDVRLCNFQQKCNSRSIWAISNAIRPISRAIWKLVVLHENDLELQFCV
jgi:hypothetical protein